MKPIFHKLHSLFFESSPPTRVLALFALVMLLLTFTRGIFFILQPREAGQPDRQSTPPFTIKGNRILDPQGNPFIVKGVEAIYGRFAGGDPKGVGLINYKNAQRDLDKMKALGVNLIRVSVSADAANLPPGNPNYIPTTLYMQQLDNAVRWITQRGMVVEISQGETEDFNKALQFVSMLAGRYKSDPFVWIQPDNEPNCLLSDHSHCYDWRLWQKQQIQYIQVIRRADNTAPIVVNTVGWSGILDDIASYPLGDKNVIYGVHIFNDGATTFTPTGQMGEAWIEAHWADLAVNFPIIVDKVGAYNKGFAPSLTWNQGFMDYVTDWVNYRQGDGAIAFVDHWSDANSLFDIQGNLSEWGDLFFYGYIAKVSQ